MGKYVCAFRLSFAEQLTYRLNFWLGRIRSMVFFLLLYFVWLTLSEETGQFAGFTGEELTTYVFLATLLRTFVFGGNSRKTSQEINSGEFSAYLTKPVNHFWFVYFRELAERLIPTVSVIAELVLFALILKARLFIQPDWTLIGWGAVSALLAHLLYAIMSYAMSLIAFWSREAMGPFYLFEYIIIFTSGQVFPLSIVRGMLFAAFMALPFMYTAYIPIMIYLGKFSPAEIVWHMLMHALWTIAAALIARIMWKRGLMRYSGEGI